MKRIIYYAVVLLLWILTVIIWAIWHFPVPFLVLVMVHAIETLVTGISTGIRYGAGIGESVIMCMLFGVAWWRPLIKKIKAESFTDADFLLKD